MLKSKVHYKFKLSTLFTKINATICFCICVDYECARNVFLRTFEVALLTQPAQIWALIRNTQELTIILRTPFTILTILLWTINCKKIIPKTYFLIKLSSEVMNCLYKRQLNLKGHCNSSRGDHSTECQFLPNILAIIYICKNNCLGYEK